VRHNRVVLLDMKRDQLHERPHVVE
jgi:hypothetical protein